MEFRRVEGEETSTYMHRTYHPYTPVGGLRAHDLKPNYIYIYTKRSNTEPRSGVVMLMIQMRIRVHQ